MFRKGYLMEKDLEDYIFELVYYYAQLQDLEKEFMCFYVLTAVRKFFFFLDPKRTGKIFIKDILQSPLLRELHELKSDSCTNDQLQTNWFTPANAFRVYNQYVRLDLN